MAKTFKYVVWFSGDDSAGMPAFSDTVDITIHSFKPNEETEEFETLMGQFLREWYDVANVELVSPASSEGEGETKP